MSASELLEHPFLHISFVSQEDKENGHYMSIMSQYQSLRKPSLAVAPMSSVQDFSKKSVSLLEANKKTNASSGFTIPSLPSTQSRLRTEFEVLMYLGKGAFGDVLKVHINRPNLFQ